MDRIALLKGLERGAAVLRRAGLGRFVDRLRGRALEGLGAFTAEIDGVTLTGDTAAHSSYVREMQDGSREGYMIELWRSAARPGGLVVDVGAHLGLLTLVAARAGAEVIAFEPNPRTLPFLRDNLMRNGLADRVTVVERAVAAEPGRRTFFLDVGGDTSSLHRHAGSRDEVTVQCAVADDVIGERVVDAMKIDVEGAELEALAGLERTIRRSPGLQLFIECNPGALAAAGASPEELVGRLLGLGLEPMVIDEERRELRPFAGTGAAPYVNLVARPSAAA
jgi:FkbM family methyltransferase